MMRTTGVAAGLVAALTAGPAPAPPPAPLVTEVANGVYLFQTPPYGEVGLDGNSVAIVSDEGVLVFDTNGTPAAAEAVLERIRAITPQPVRWVVNSHWHWDHWYGTDVYRRAFPGVKVVAHERTRAMMAGPAIEFNRPGLETELPGYLRALEDRVTVGEQATPPPPDLPRLREQLDAGRFFLAQKRGAILALPDVTYTDRLTMHLGGREIQLRHYDRAVTPGDTLLYLPKERVLLTGDLLVNPVSFALSCYPTGWLRTLERLDALDAAVIVPGHGAPLRDKRLLRATMAVFRALLARGAEAHAKGLDADAARAAMMPGLRDLMVPVTGDVPAVNAAFETQLVDWFLHRVYDELDGPMTDAIAPIPPR